MTLPNLVSHRRLDPSQSSSSRNYHFEIYIPGESADIPLDIRPVRRHALKMVDIHDLDAAARAERNRRRLQDGEVAARARILASASAYAGRYPGWLFATSTPDPTHVRLWCLAVPRSPGHIYGNRIIPPELPSYAISYEVPSPIPGEELVIPKISGAWDPLNITDPVATFGRLIDRLYTTGAIEPERTVRLTLNGQVAATRAGRYALLTRTETEAETATP